MKKLLALALVFAFAGASSAFAQTGSVTGSTGTSVNTDTVGASADTETSVDLDTPVRSDDSDMTYEGDDSNGNADADNQGTDTVNLDLGSTASFNLSRGDSSVESGSSAMGAASVSSDADLEAFAASTIRSNDSVEGVEVSDGSLRVSYQDDVRLFGFIPLTVTNRVEVASDGSVRVVRPWYSFLTTGGSAIASSEIESRVRATLDSAGALSADGTLSARAQAQVLAEIAAALGGTTVSGSSDASSSADAGASGSANASTSDDGTPDQGSGDR